MKSVINRNCESLGPGEVHPMSPGRARAGRIPGSLHPCLSQKHRHTYPRNPGQGWAPRKLGQRFPHILVWPSYLPEHPSSSLDPLPKLKVQKPKVTRPNAKDYFPRPTHNCDPSTTLHLAKCPSHHRSLASQEARVSDVREGNVEAEVNKYLSFTNSGFLDLPTGTQ